MTATSIPAGTGTDEGLGPVGRLLRSKAFPTIVALILLLALWELVGLTIYRHTHTIPAPTQILHAGMRFGADAWWANLKVTLREAGKGWLYGNVLAIACAIVFVQFPIAEKAFMQLAVASYCLPLIVLGVILSIEFSGDEPKVILAAVSVFFTTLIGALLGLKSADRTSLELVRAYGGGRWTQLVKVRFRACLPSLFAGLRIAAPAAVLGAILGEWMGSDSGLGTAMVAAQTAFEVERTWAIALVATAVSGGAYAVTALIGNLLTPWAEKVDG